MDNQYIFRTFLLNIAFENCQLYFRCISLSPLFQIKSWF